MSVIPILRRPNTNIAEVKASVLAGVLETTLANKTQVAALM
jgi:hypothetical protein